MAGPVWSPSGVGVCRRPAPTLIALDDGWAAAPSWERRVHRASVLLDAARARRRAGRLAAHVGRRDRAATDRWRGGGGAFARRPAEALAARPPRGRRACRGIRGGSRGSAHFLGRRRVGAGRGARFRARRCKRLRSRARASKFLRTLIFRIALAAPANDAKALRHRGVARKRCGRRARRGRGAGRQGPRGRARAVRFWRARRSPRRNSNCRSNYAMMFHSADRRRKFRRRGLAAGRGRQGEARGVILSGASAEEAQPLLSAAYYLEKALAPFTAASQGAAR